MEIKDCKVGMKVTFGRANGEHTLGEIVKVNSVKCKVKQLESRGTMKDHKVGTIWTVPTSLLTPVGDTTLMTAVPAPSKPKRPDAEIMNDIQRCYAQLEPENLSCDGECSRSEVVRRATAIRARLRDLFTEIGRKVTEDESFGIPDAHRALATRTDDVGELGSVPRDSLKSRYPWVQKGSKVCFTSKDGTVVTGYVRTLNTKSVTVDPIGETNGRYWRVIPSELRAA